MIAAWHSWQDQLPAPSDAICSALDAFRGKTRHLQTGRTVLFEASTPQRAAPRTVLHGWIDNAAEISRAIGIEYASDANLYDAALMRWGDDADRRLIGNYAAISVLGNGDLRLCRTPWNAPPLHFANDRNRCIASPLLRALFAAGVPQNLDYERVVDQLAYDFREDDLAGWYHGLSTVPLGCAIIVQRGSHSAKQWYSLDEISSDASTSLEDTADQAFSLLQDASVHTLDRCSSPALALSGGLDSTLTAAALTDVLDVGSNLKTITFRPDPDWEDSTSDGICGDEWGKVQGLAKYNSKIDPHFADPNIGGFDHLSREMLSAMRLFAPGLSNVGMYHGVYRRAKQLGCNWLLSADLGNQSFSNDARWAYAEYARSGQWRELMRLLAARPGDSRPLWRKTLALSVLPQLPAGLRRRIRGFVHPQRAEMAGHLSLLSPAALASQSKRAAARGSGSEWHDLTYPRSQREAAKADLRAENGEGADVTMAFEQLYGIRHRDVTAYRPLIEFCMSLPTRHFASAGIHRRLARTMAKGRLPDSIRHNTAHGMHNIDWFTRMGRNRTKLLAATKVLRGHTVLSSILDIDRIETLLTDWPETQTHDIDSDWPRMLGIPRAMIAAQLIGIVEGRNDL